MHENRIFSGWPDLHIDYDILWLTRNKALAIVVLLHGTQSRGWV